MATVTCELPDFDPEEFVSRPQAARLLRVGRKKLDEMISAGTLKAIAVPGCRTRISRADLAELIRRSFIGRTES